MDIALARTFLEVAAQGSFVAAARTLHLTQTAVGARVRNLEDQLGTALFQRHKNGVFLTAAGERFVPYASSLLQLWERATHQVGLPPGQQALVALGCERTLWDSLLLKWLNWMSTGAPEIAVRAEIGSSRALEEQVGNGTLDIAVVYGAHHRPGLRVECLLEEKLVLVTTRADASPPEASEYVHVEWGLDFGERHRLLCPQWSRPPVSSDFGPLLREYVLSTGGAGYFRLSLVRGHLASGRLHRVRGAPEFPYPVCAVHAEGADPDVLHPALEGLRHAAAAGANQC